MTAFAPIDWIELRDWCVDHPLDAADEITRLRRPVYVIAEIGCIECGDDTVFQAVAETRPEMKILTEGDSHRVSYSDSIIAFEV